jgi:hypothetical protein
MNTSLINFTFPELEYGTHETPYDLATMLYVGGSAARRDQFSALVAKGILGRPVVSRLPLIHKIHDDITSDIARGLSRESIAGLLSAFRYFFLWCDEENIEITLASALDNYLAWCEHLLHRVRIVKNLKNKSAYGYAKRIDPTLSRILNIERGLFRRSRLTPPSAPINKKSAKANLEKSFEFGHFLLDICNCLTLKTIRGQLPIKILLRNGLTLVESGRMKPDSKVKSLKAGAIISEKKLAIQRRAPLPENVSTIKRSNLINLRIESELLIFMSQTGMNLAQAFRCKREKFRYQTEKNDTIVYRTYKGRREGEALFKIYKEYTELLNRYLEWLDSIFAPSEERLFPFVYDARVPRPSSAPALQNIKHRCERLNIPHLNSRDLRNLRANWLLRKSADPDLTAEMSQHTKEILFKHYTKPQHQIAAAEIARFHSLTDPSITPPAPGLCVGNSKPPIPLKDTVIDAPKPDCGNAAGCFFCIYHRDIDCFDYIWSLISYRHCKRLELDYYISKLKENTKPPSVILIDRITLKLNEIENSSAIRASWVQEARDRIREGHYHPAFDGVILIMEIS